MHAVFKQSILSKSASLILLGLSALLVALLLRAPLTAALAQQALSQPAEVLASQPPCATFSERGIDFEFLGYLPQADETTLVAWRITNPNDRALDAVGFTAQGWTPVTPADGTVYDGALGGYQVRRALHNLIPSHEAGALWARFQPQGNWFKSGAAETFVLTVRNFDPQRQLFAWAHANLRLTQVHLKPAAYNCLVALPTPSPTPTATATNTPPPFSPLPTPSATPEGYTLPTQPVVAACVFTPPPGGSAEEPVIPLSAYSFAEPQVVLTNTAPIGIQQWLPNSEQLLVTRHTGKGNMLELVNTSTLEITTLVEPNRAIKAPRWLAQDQSVVWVELGGGNHEPGLWLRSFDPPGERHLSGSGTGSGISHDVSPDGKQIVFLSLPGGTQPYIWNQETKTLQALPVDLGDWRYQKPNVLYPLRPFNAHWQPGGEKILFEDGIWLFLYDLTTNRACEIDMNVLSPIYPSVHEASWSLNGRYLLLKIAFDPPYTSFRGPNGALFLLDTFTGSTMRYSLDNAVYGFSWAPDNQTVAMTGLTGEKIRHFDLYGIYLLNILSGEYRQILPGQDIGNVQWSPNGNRLVFQCQNYFPDDESNTYLDRICISHASMNQ